TVDEVKIIEPKTLSQIHSPVITMAADRSAEEIELTHYAMGWMVGSYRRHHLLTHDGGVDGFVTTVGLLPNEKAGVVVLSNRPESQFTTIISLMVYDRLLGLAPIPWLEMLQESKKIKPPPSSQPE